MGAFPLQGFSEQKTPATSEPPFLTPPNSGYIEVMRSPLAGIIFPGGLAVVGIALLAWWTGARLIEPFEERGSGSDGAPLRGLEDLPPRAVIGQPVISDGEPSKLPGSWPWFRGENRDAICDDGVRLARQWPPDGPERLWTVELGEGYAAAAVSQGRVYVLDHQPDMEVDQLRSLSQDERERLADALSSLSPATFDRLHDVLRGLYAIAGEESRDVSRSVSRDEYDALTDALRSLFLEKRDELIRALRNDSLRDVDRSADTMRCLSLRDGREIWRNSYTVIVPEHHGRSRTIPAVIGEYVISLGPKCHVACWDAESGKCHWLLDLVLDHGATVPPWYAGQCPLIDVVTDRLILAPGGKALLMAVDYRTGEVLWESPNPQGWAMTHVSIVPMELAGRRMYVYCGKGGVAGVAADDGTILWETADWQIGTATCPSPVVVGDGRVFLCGGYNAGALMLQVKQQGGRFVAETLFRLKPRQFSSEQQTPILFDGYLYGVRQKDERLVCLDLEGNEAWNSGRDKFGSGSYMIADGLIFVMNDGGQLTMAEATSKGYRPLPDGPAQVIDNGYESWGPMAMAAGRLIVRDLTRMRCLDVAE